MQCPLLREPETVSNAEDLMQTESSVQSTSSVHPVPLFSPCSRLRLRLPTRRIQGSIARPPVFLSLFIGEESLTLSQHFRFFESPDQSGILSAEAS